MGPDACASDSSAPGESSNMAPGGTGNTCYNDGRPGLTDSNCVTNNYGHEFAYSIPGSQSKNGCCKQKDARQCTIIATPGGLDPGATFECTRARGGRRPALLLVLQKN